MQIAIFDTSAGYLQWIGEAEDHAAAVRAMNASVGLWEAAADRSDVLQRAEDASLLVMDVTDEQAEALQVWAERGANSSGYPEGLPDGVLYTCGEVLKMVEL